jgi:hypothetical protein
MSDWKRDSERVEYASAFRKDAECENKNGQTIVSHVSMAEVQAPESVKSSIEFRAKHPDYFDKESV